MEVLEIELHPAAKFETVGTVDNPRTGDAGADEMALRLNSGEFFGFFEGKGARADKAHVAFDDVEKLGQLIETGIGEKLADADKTRVRFDFEDRTVGFVEVAIAPLLGVGLRAHGTKFDEVEGARLFAEAFLSEKNG